MSGGATDLPPCVPSASTRSAAGRVRQQTLGGAVCFEGWGLHTGRPGRVRVLPAPAGAGLTFHRIDQGEAPPIPAHVSAVVETNRRVVLGRSGVRIESVEHLLAACVIAGLDNARIEVEGSEIPSGDGSAIGFIRHIEKAGLIPQRAAAVCFSPISPIAVRDGPRGARLIPHPQTCVSARIVFSHPSIGEQSRVSPIERWKVEIAPARTFVHFGEIAKLRRQGLALGGGRDQVLVLGDGGWMNPELRRFEDEPVRHKILDALGDLALIGGRFAGKLELNASGHDLHVRLARLIVAAMRGMSRATAVEFPGEEFRSVSRKRLS